MATALENLITARDNLAQIIANKTTEWVADGCPPSYSIDGESMSWNEWLASKTTAIAELDKAIGRIGKFIVRSRGKP